METLISKDEAVDLPPATDPSKDYLAMLVGENAKFKTVNDMARGKFEADQYITILERQRDEMREENYKLREETKTRARLEDLVDQLRQQPSNEQPEVKEQETQPFDPNQFKSLITDELKNFRQQEKEQENWNTVKDKLQQAYGNNYKQVVKDRIEDLGITEQELNDMARKQPKVLIKSLGLDNKPDSSNQFQAPPHTQRRSDNFAPSAAPARTWAYYEDLRKKDKNLYFDRKTAIQMQKDAIELGDKFYDGNFYVPGLHERNN